MQLQQAQQMQSSPRFQQPQMQLSPRTSLALTVQHSPHQLPQHPIGHPQHQPPVLPSAQQLPSMPDGSYHQQYNGNNSQGLQPSRSSLSLHSSTPAGGGHQMSHQHPHIIQHTQQQHPPANSTTAVVSATNSANSNNIAPPLPPPPTNSIPTAS
ncbi:hypothetical protein GQ42DRAFT_46451 [Ramicandelaber brevisporus]|nr:hypothetical protein GQ42DRAFT_46451 [Ramicandelaber brevisporus]